jgi:tight adherence protein B
VDRALSRGDPPIALAVAAFLDGVAATLRGGTQLRAALEHMASRPGVLAPIVRAVLARAVAGVPLGDALRAGAARHPSAELRLAFAAMALALDTGAAHAATLDRVAQRVRDRIALDREIRALSASARASAVVVSAAPLALVVVVLLVDPHVVAVAFGSGPGRGCFAVGLAFEGAGGWWMRGLVVRARRPAAATVALDELPEAVELLGLAMAAGHGVPAAISAAARVADGVCGRVLRTSAARLAAGEGLAAVLARWPLALGDDARPLVVALTVAHEDGVRAADSLDRVAADLRHARRQRAAERVQRLPVAMLFPLVCCVLPAFLLLSVVPIAIGSIRTFGG